MGLARYKAKRDLKRTSEPGAAPRKRDAGALVFVVQRHKASHLHYDFRLELDGVLKSWAVPKGPSMAPADKRLAMMVEDHPYDYKDFSGVIPEGNYGAGIVEIWDRGTYTPLDAPAGKDPEAVLRAMLRKGSLKLVLKGRKLKGEFALVRFAKGGDKSWLLIKHKDRYAKEAYDSEDETPKTSPINKALRAQEKTKRPAPRKARKKAGGANSRAPQAVPVPARARRGTRGIRGNKVGAAIAPMLAAPDTKPFDDPDWLFEVKWDGYRAIAETGGRQLRFYSRNGLSFLDLYPDVVRELRQLDGTLALDGEVVALDAQGRPDFQLLQHAAQDPDTHVVYYVFDLLRMGPRDIMHLPLTERKALLREAIADGEHVRYCDHVEEQGRDFFAAAAKQDLEGIIGKRKDSTYTPGVRSRAWVKIKHHLTQEVVIGGYTAPRNSRAHFGALLLGYYRNGQLIYAGHAGTGFDHRSLTELMALMAPLHRKTSPFATPAVANMPPVWISPKLTCNVKFTGWTRDGRMRHPVYLGLRPDKDPRTVIREPMSTKARKRAPRKRSSVARSAKAPRQGAVNSTGDRSVRAGRHTVHLTNLQKLYWPDEGITKGDVIAYYERMHAVLLPHLKDRPQSLYRTPDGVARPGFYHKDAGGDAPAWVRSLKVPSESRGAAVDYILCNDLATLLYLANLGCIELNPWNSRKRTLLKPDHLVMDLDPSDKNTFDDVVEAALAVKSVLDAIGVEGFCKTSGASGLHIYIPTGTRYTYDELAPLAKGIMLAVNDLLPDTTTLVRSLRKRDKGQIYLDHLQNRKGQTLASVYSIRPRPGATVSTPLEWKEVKAGLDRHAFTIASVPRRVDRRGDLFAPLLGHKGFALSKVMKALEGLTG